MQEVLEYKDKQHALILLLSEGGRIAVNCKRGDILIDEIGRKDGFCSAAMSPKTALGFTLEEDQNDDVQLVLYYGDGRRHEIGQTVQSAQAKKWVLKANKILEEKRTELVTQPSFKRNILPEDENVWMEYNNCFVKALQTTSSDCFGSEVYQVLRAPIQRIADFSDVLIFVAHHTTLEDKEVWGCAYQADLMRVNGIAERYAEMLFVVGFYSTEDLAHYKPKNVHSRLLAYSNVYEGESQRIPSVDKIQKWVRQARKMSAVVVSR